MRTLTTVCVLLFCATAALAGGESQQMERSIYVPITFKTCEHISQAVLYLSDAEGNELQPLLALPGERIFQFTYYPSLGRMEPERSIIKMVGQGPHGTVSHYVTVTPEAIYLTQDRQIELSEKVLKKLSFRRDVRHTMTTLTFQCDAHEKPKEVIVAKNEH